MLNGDDRQLIWNASPFGTIALLSVPVLFFVGQFALWRRLSIRGTILVLMIIAALLAFFLWGTTPLLGGDRDIFTPGAVALIAALTLGLIVRSLGASTGLGPRPRIHPRVKAALYQEFGGRCALCKDKHDIGNLEVDHIRARALGGPDAYENYQLLCGRCNRLKGTGTNAEARKKLRA